VPAENKNSNQTLTSKFGLDSFVSSRKNGDIFCFAMLLGAALQKLICLVILLSEILVLILSIKGTLGGTLCINYFAFADFRNLIYLNYPFFLRRFGIKQVMIF
jgi:NHS family xanthosine MFS transporter